MENKKTKLTISGNPKKSFKKFDTSKNQGKKTVFIDRKSKKPNTKGNFTKPTSGPRPSSNNFKKSFSLNPNFNPKTSTSSSDFERRKLAEQRATKRLKGDQEKNKKQK